MSAKVFLSYARSDALDAVKKLKTEIQQAGFQTWRDLEEMRGGKDWKDQLRDAIKQSDIIVVLLTPASVISENVKWEIDTAVTLDKPMIGILILPCQLPEDLKKLHYHDLSSDEKYSLNLMALVRDLREIETKVDASDTIQSKVAKQPESVFYQPDWKVKGNVYQQNQGNMNFNQTDRDEALRNLLEMYEVGQQELIRAISGKLDRQQVSLIEKLVTVIDQKTISDSEIETTLMAVKEVLEELNSRKIQLESGIAEDVEKVAEVVNAPALDARHRLKVTVPIIPILLAYEGEIELNSGMNLENAWLKLKRFLQRNG